MITFDAAAITAINSAGGVQDFTHVVGTGRGTVLEVFLDYAYNIDTSQRTSGLTFNGKSLTKLSHATQADISGNTIHSEIWYLLNPDVGSHTLEVSFLSALTSGRAIASASYLVTDSNAPSDFRNTNTNPTDGIDTAVTTKDNGWILTFFGVLSGAPTFTAVTGTIRLQNSLGAIVDRGPCSPAGSFTNEVTPSENSNLNIIGCTIYPSLLIPQASAS